GDGFIVDLGGAEELHAVLPLADGRVLLAGWSNHSGNNKFLVVVLQQDGTPDASVGSDGLLEFDVVPGQDNEAWGLARDPDGRILVFGSTSAGAEDDLAIIRLLP
ncbi:MAG TPA: delta-60 repeat domain-containing protein, partial [Kofleriaceae bacterium]|nr:delta-60 repeat domain-containing protein [Kofleriaceae bacterium]